MADYYIKQGDTYPALVAQLQDANSTGVNLVGCTVNVHVKLQGSVLFNRPCTIIDAANGWVQYNWQTGDTATPGTATMEFQVTFSNGTDITRFPDDRQLEVLITRNLNT